MPHLPVTFDAPYFLLLLVTIPLLWWMARRSLAGMSAGRRWLALGVRSLVALCLILALADIQGVRVIDRIATWFLLDQSWSVDPAQRAASLDYVRSATAAHRQRAKEDAAGVIVFGAGANVESPLFAGDIPLSRIESPVDPTQTNLGAALRLANATYPHGVGKRVVIVSDGNETLGNARLEAESLAQAGAGIDVALLPTRAAPDVLVEKVAAPSVPRAGMPFDVLVVLRNVSPPNVEPKPVAGRLRVLRKTGDSEQLIADEPVTVRPGKQVITLRQELTTPGFFTYEARFQADDPALDRESRNNQASAYTQLRDRGRVLFIVNAESPDEYAHLIERLRAAGIEVDVQSTDTLFTRLADLQPYDSVVLANVPRTSGNDADSLVHISDEQIEMLVANSEKLGAGLVMLGGPDSFGAGGWASTRLEEAMPVDFRIENSQVVAVGALMLVIDRSGSMDGEKIAMSRAAAKAAVEMLGPRDEVGIISFDSEATDVVRLGPISNRRRAIDSRISRIAAGGGTNMEPAMRRGYQALRQSKASVKHMIVLTDGQTEGSGFAQMAAENQRQGITTTTVAVGADAARSLLQEIAIRGQGKYYYVNSPKAIPRIFMREARRVARPLIFEQPEGFQPDLAQTHEVVQGIGDVLPPISGYVLTTPKDNPLVELPIVSPVPDKKNHPILATWTYGLGRTAVFTTDGGQRWAQSWPAWEQYDRLFTQLVRWSMRPLADHESFTVATDVTDGRLRVTVSAVNPEGEFLNGLPMQGLLVGGSDGVSSELAFRQIGPGRYIAETPLQQAGSYLVALQPGLGHGLIRTGVSVPYSPEFEPRATNEALLIGLSQLTPPGGRPGEIIRLPDDPATWSQWRGPDIFRRDLPPGRLLSSLWPPMLLAAASLFLLDVANRRLWITAADVARLVPWLRRNRQDQPPARLASAKRDTAGSFAMQASEAAAIEPDRAKANEPPPPSDAPSAGSDDDASYVQRLLRVKQNVRQADRRSES